MPTQKQNEMMSQFEYENTFFAEMFQIAKETESTPNEIFEKVTKERERR